MLNNISTLVLLAALDGGLLAEDGVDGGAQPLATVDAEEQLRAIAEAAANKTLQKLRAHNLVLRQALPQTEDVLGAFTGDPQGGYDGMTTDGEIVGQHGHEVELVEPLRTLLQYPALVSPKNSSLTRLSSRRASARLPVPAPGFVRSRA